MAQNRDADSSQFYLLEFEALNKYITPSRGHHFELFYSGSVARSEAILVQQRRWWPRSRPRHYAEEHLPERQPIRAEETAPSCLQHKDFTTLTLLSSRMFQ